MEEPTRTGSQSDWPVDSSTNRRATARSAAKQNHGERPLKRQLEKRQKMQRRSKARECKADCPGFVVEVGGEVDESQRL